MKQVNNNEVDLLLRSLARRPDQSQAGAPSGGVGASSDHLDPDELSSYAEGVVPAPARARYIEHLADCQSCRGIVVDLTQAAGVATQYEVPQSHSGSTFWQKLGAVLSPAVLRFAVPALVLTVVIGIGLFALRDQAGQLTARNNATDAPPSADKLKSTGPALDSSTAPTPSSAPSGTVASVGSGSPQEKSDLQNRKTEVDQATVSEEPRLAKAPAKDAAQPGDDADAGVATQPYAAEPKAAAPPAPATTVGSVEKSAEVAKENAAKREDQKLARDEYRIQTDGEHGPNRGRNSVNNTQSANNTPSANNAPAAGARNRDLMAQRGPSANKNQNQKGGENQVVAVETRTVSNKRFTREGNVWVDDDYERSQATIKVARGSEQFRALVADEPGLRAFADKLSGVVIVVWKNRAYRIQ